MSIWIEFRCEGRRDDDSYECWSHQNDGPADEAGDTQEEVRKTISAMTKKAVRIGWMRDKEGWFCPVCVRRRAQAGEGGE